MIDVIITYSFLTIYLLTRGFIEYVTQGNKTVTSLNPLKEKLYREFQLSLSKEAEIASNEKASQEINNIYETFQKLLGRPLSPVEQSKVNEWVNFGYSDETIINALKDALAKGKKSLRSVDKILLSYVNRDDRENEGHSTMTSDWNKNLEETIRIAKTPWINTDDED